MTPIGRPQSAASALFGVIRSASIPVGAPIVVADGDAVAFMQYGMVSGVLGPGTHAADPAQIPFLYNFAPPGGGEMTADLMFVRTVEHGWWEMSAPPHSLSDPRTGERFDIRFTGSFSVQITDPHSFARDTRDDDERPLYTYVESVVDRACRDSASAMMSEGTGVRDLALEQHARALADRTVTQVAGVLTGHPIRVVRFGSLLVHYQ
jgi:membrane protease subunit (stomatin/prohibitin family)